MIGFLESGDDPADTAVHAVHHGGVGAAVFVLDMGVEGEIFLGGVHGGVRGVVGKEEEPGVIFFLVDPGDGFVAEEVGEIGGGKFGEGGAVAFELVFFGGGEVGVRSIQHADEVVEASLVGVEFGAGSLVPFADEGGLVVKGFEVVGNRVFRDGKAEEFGACGVGGGPLVEVALVSEAAGVATGKESGAGG